MRTANELFLSAPADLTDSQLFLWLERVRMFAVSRGDESMEQLVESIKFAKSASPFSAMDKLNDLKASLSVIVEIDADCAARASSSKHVNPRMFDGDVISETKTSDCRPFNLRLMDEPKFVGRDVNSVFLVHGHNDKMRFEVKDFLQNTLGFSVIVLSEQPDNGRTIIEKLCGEIKRCGRAVVLYSPDDKMADGEMRARQNVVFEHGLLYSELGTQNVIAMVDGSVKMPGDLDGVIYVSYTDDWKERIRRNWGKC